jgi:hypothetical protein
MTVDPEGNISNNSLFGDVCTVIFCANVSEYIVSWP